MARSLLRQDTQIHNSEVYDDSLVSGATLESSAVTLEEDLNALRSQVNRILDATGGGNWYDAIPTVNAKTRSILQLNTGLDAVEEKKMLWRATVLTDFTVVATRNWHVLNVAGSQAPTAVAAVALTQVGAVVAQSALSAGAFNVHELIAVTGANPLAPRNLCLIREGDTGDPILSSGRQVFALLQYESTGADGGSFNDTSGGSRVKLSFVRPNATFDALEAVPVADIENKEVNYSYVIRYTLSTTPEYVFLSGQFIDQAASVDVTRQNAYNFQGTLPVELTTNADLDLAASVEWAIRDVTNTDLFNLAEGSTGSNTTLTIGSAVDFYQNNAADVDFNVGITANESGTRPIAIGLTDGVVSSVAGDLGVRAFAELYLDDANQAGSTWTQTDGIKLSDTTAEWDNFESAFGEVSLLKAITQAYSAGGAIKYVATLTANVPANTNVTFPTNLSAALGDYSALSFVANVDVYLNGQLLRNGADASANNDVYPGTTPASGDLKFEFALKGTGANPDVLTMFIRG